MEKELSAILVHWYTEKREQLVKITFFFVFTISSLVSLLLSRFYRSKKYVRDISTRLENSTIGGSG